MGKSRYSEEQLPGGGDEEHQQQEDFDRTELIDRINDFYHLHEEGPKQIMEFCVNFYKDQTYMKERLNEKYKDYLNIKKKYQQQLEEVKQEFLTLQQKNQYIQDMDNDEKLEQEHQIARESLDSGII